MISPLHLRVESKFNYSQTSLQDFVDCPRRFYLRYIKKIKWPAVQSEPAREHEIFVLEGNAFHEAVRQYFLDVPEEKIRTSLSNSGLELWWDAFLPYVRNNSSLISPVSVRLPEFTLVGTLDQRKITAKYDLLVISPGGRITILDWKTSPKKPERSWLLGRIQTKLYPVLVTLGGKNLDTNGIIPENITMIYWFANQSGQTESIEFSEQKFIENKQEILSLISQIERLSKQVDEKSFPKTVDVKKCSFCVYRSLCGTGLHAGSLDDYQDYEPEDISIDFDQITEVSF